MASFILEPGPGSPDRRYRLMMPVRDGIEHVSGTAYDLTVRDALYLIFCALGHEFALTPEDVLRGAAKPAA